MNPPADVDAMLDVWRLPRPRITAKAEGGYQNATLFVSCADGEFVLRVYSNVVDPARQRFEHELLRRLASAELSFGVPRPLPSDDGDTLRVVEGRLVAVFARIPGETLAKDGGPYVGKAAAALAELDVALAAIQRFDHRPPTYDADLSRVHPLVDDLDEAVLESGLEPRRAALLRRGLERTAELAVPLYASLPQQITHGDFAFGNTLVRDGRVTGLIDFEVAGMDVRAMDLAVGLYRFPASDDALGQCDTFGRGYSSVLPLDPMEIAALPALLELRAGVSFMHWVGRMRAGLATIDDVRPRAGRALFTYEWARANGDELVRRAMGWIGELV
ncbi:MAG TPA: phosphotransferase [Candidatus Limnocylindria bacterium]|nr:phosphotransferase [Candidatus Limnocylindria bacterium]